LETRQKWGGDVHAPAEDYEGEHENEELYFRSGKNVKCSTYEINNVGVIAQRPGHGE